MSLKFYPKCGGPFEILEKQGPVTYKLKLPKWTKAHDVFHASMLKLAKQREGEEAFTFPRIDEVPFVAFSKTTRGPREMAQVEDKKVRFVTKSDGRTERQVFHKVV